MNETAYNELKRIVEWNEGYDTAKLITKCKGFEEAKEMQNKLHEAGKSNQFITGYVHYLVMYSQIPF